MGREYQGKFAFANNLKPTPVFECPDELAYTFSPLRAPLLGPTAGLEQAIFRSGRHFLSQFGDSFVEFALYEQRYSVF